MAGYGELRSAQAAARGNPGRRVGLSASADPLGSDT